MRFLSPSALLATSALLRRAPLATTRVLRPSTLYAAIPAATFDGVAERLPALSRS